MQVVLYPLDRAVIGEKTIMLGMHKTSVWNTLGKGESFDGKRYYYFNSEVAIDFDDEDKVEFIEFLAGTDGELKPVIYGLSAFEENADTLTEVLTKKNNGEIDDAEKPYSYGFPAISVGIYRECFPEEIIQEARDEGRSLEDDDVRADLRKAMHWSTIGIGVKDYYKD